MSTESRTPTPRHSRYDEENPCIEEPLPKRPSRNNSHHLIRMGLGVIVMTSIMIYAGYRFSRIQKEKPSLVVSVDDKQVVTFETKEFGITWATATNGNGAVVAAVAAGSPAEVKGVSPGSHILKITVVESTTGRRRLLMLEHDVRDMSVEDLEKLIESLPDGALTLTFSGSSDEGFPTHEPAYDNKQSLELANTSTPETLVKFSPSAVDLKRVPMTPFGDDWYAVAFYVPIGRNYRSKDTPALDIGIASSESPIVDFCRLSDWYYEGEDMFWICGSSKLVVAETDDGATDEKDSTRFWIHALGGPGSPEEYCKTKNHTPISILYNKRTGVLHYRHAKHAFRKRWVPEPLENPTFVVRTCEGATFPIHVVTEAHRQAITERIGALSE